MRVSKTLRLGSSPSSPAKKTECYHWFMILTKNEPFTLQEISLLREQFDVYIKTVIDIEKKVC